MCSVEEFMGGSCFGGLCLLGGGHLAGSSYTRCCHALTCSESHRSTSNKLGLPWLSCSWTSIAIVHACKTRSFIVRWTIQIYNVPENDQTIPIVLHVILVKAMWPRINQWQSLFSWVKVKKYNKMCYLLPILPLKFRNVSIQHDIFVPARDTSQWSKHGGKWRDRRRQKLPVFTFRDEHNNDSTTQTWSLKLKATIFKVIPEEKQQLLEDKDADNVREVLGKSFKQWF